MIGRVGLVYATGNSATFNPFNSVKLAADYATDTSFRSRVAASEFDWEPGFGLLPANEEYWPVPLGPYRPYILWQAAFHAEYGYTLKAGQKAQLSGDPSSARGGPIATVSVLPFPYPYAGLNQFQVNVSYEYLRGFVGSPSDSHDFKVQATYPFPGLQNASLTLSYEDGLTPIVKDKVQSLTLGLGLKF